MMTLPRNQYGYVHSPNGLALSSYGGARYLAVDGYNQCINDLCDKYANRPIRDANINLILEMVSAFKYAVAKDFAGWLCFNLTQNPYLSDTAIDFILDTLNFIEGNGRKLPMNAWVELIAPCKPASPSVMADRKHLAKQITTPKTVELICNWLKQPTGIDDMFQTCKILFGNR